MIERDSNGVFQLTETVIFSCGCSGVGPKVTRMKRSAGIDTPILNVNLKPRAKVYIKRIGLDKAIPTLAKSKYAVMYNPHTTQFIDLLNAPENESVYENMRRVANVGS